MIITVKKENGCYLLGDNIRLSEMAWEVLPYLQQPSGNYFWLLLKAALDLDIRYYRNPSDNSRHGINYELDFYNHLGCRWEVYAQDVNEALTVNSDIVKIMSEERRPDLILNERYNDRQEIVVEFKRNVSTTTLDLIFEDLNKLFCFTKGTFNRRRKRYEFISGYKSYNIGVFFFMCGTMNDLLNKFNDDIPRFNDYMKKIGKWKSRLFCICSSGDGSLEYVTMEELAKETVLRKKRRVNK